MLDSVWLARYLRARALSLYSYALAFVALLSAMTDLGLDGVVVRNLVRDAQAPNYRTHAILKPRD